MRCPGLKRVKGQKPEHRKKKPGNTGAQMIYGRGSCMEKKLRKMKKAVAVTLAVVMSLISAGMAALAEDAPAKTADDRVISEEVKNQLKAAAEEFPEKLDLRDYDKDGDGKGENYVTPVKAQHPFGTCWYPISSGTISVPPPERRITILTSPRRISPGIIITASPLTI